MSGRLTSSDVLTWLARLIVGGFFIAASVHKIIDPAAFAKSIYNYQILPSAFINVSAILLPWLEMVCGLALILWPSFRRASAALILAMLVVFTIAIIAALVRGIDIACGCFSSTPEAGHMGWWNVLRNVCLIKLCAYEIRER